ncbi:hypothetical protein LOD99_12257 [Oopsacas minuta]|uniref:F5/8 type C domain-containing protein n=1 Tax=Oopsacas minuta TaxID=111878 RepID=A0AAV7JEW3_9METZ|nr:hypothetical protein LOD99_12257 [Oopsacas minuta]
MNIFHIITLLLTIICVTEANDNVNSCPSCEMPCRVSAPDISRSSLIKLYSSSVDSYTITTILDGYNCAFRVTVSQNSTVYLARKNVCNWSFDTHCRILSGTPKITPVRNDNTRLKVGFPAFRNFHVHLKPAEDYVASLFYEKVGLIQNELSITKEQLSNTSDELATTNEQLSNTSDELATTTERLELLIEELEERDLMRSRLKYAIANSFISGNDWGCQEPNPMIYPNGQKYCYSTAGNWIHFDLKEKFTINLIRFHLWEHDYRVYTYQLSISPDRVNWESIAAGVTGHSIQEYKLDNPTDIRYIRMEGNNTLSRYLQLLALSVDWV